MYIYCKCEKRNFYKRTIRGLLFADIREYTEGTSYVPVYNNKIGGKNEHRE